MSPEKDATRMAKVFLSWLEVHGNNPKDYYFEKEDFGGSVWTSLKVKDFPNKAMYLKACKEVSEHLDALLEKEGFELKQPSLPNKHGQVAILVYRKDR